MIGCRGRRSGDARGSVPEIYVRLIQDKQSCAEQQVKAGYSTWGGVNNNNNNI